MTETKTATKVATGKVPAVYNAMFEVLKAMSVEKNGTLPSNMGGKGYITAVDASAEAKRQFVDNNLIILPMEKETSKEVIVDADKRKTVTITIEGTYTIVSTVDGSSVQIGGVGDGLAIGTAVASNIASTNALKNALLRTFLVTEQSVEDAGKNGPPVAQETAPATTSGPTVASLKGEIAKLLNTKDGNAIRQLGDKFFEGKEGWADSVKDLTQWRDELKSKA